MKSKTIKFAALGAALVTTLSFATTTSRVSVADLQLVDESVTQVTANTPGSGRHGTGTGRGIGTGRGGGRGTGRGGRGTVIH